jgi:hypothetical protein
MELKFRALKAEEIEVRIGSVTDKGLSLLLYMDARAAALLLDETVGPMNWRCSYRDVNSKMYCSVDIYDSDKKEWVSKENVGTESNTEAEKGEASDGLKRAVATWGVRELYTSPFLWISKDNLKHHEKKTFNNKDTWKSNDKFTVSDIEIELNGYSRKVTRLVITNTSTGAVCFEWSLDKGQKKVVSKKENTTKKSESVTVTMYATDEQKEILMKVYKGENLNKLLEANGIKDLSELPFAKAENIIKKLEERMNKDAS